LPAKDGDDFRQFFGGQNGRDHRAALIGAVPLDHFLVERVPTVPCCGEISGKHQEKMAKIVLQCFRAQGNAAHKQAVAADRCSGDVFQGHGRGQ